MLNFLRSYLKDREWLRVLLISFFFFVVFFAIYFSVSTVSSPDDPFFHFRFAQEMWSHGFFSSFQNFQSIYFSRIAQGNAYFIYYNFLFYLVVLPFSLITPLYLGLKLYAVFVAALAFTLLYFCLKRLEIKNPFVWTLVFIAITNVILIWRFFISRPYTLAPSLLILLLVFLYRRNHIGVSLISFIYLFWHGATFFMPPGVALAYYLVERFYGSKGDLKNVLYSFCGTGLAISLTYTVSSGFFLYMKDNIVGPYIDSILGHKVPIAEGGELYPVDFFNFIQGNALIFAAFVTALSVDIASYISHRFKQASSLDYFAGLPEGRRHLQTSVLLMTAGFFLGTIALSGRFGDYFTFFAALYIALCFDYVRRLLSISGSAMIRRSVAVGLGIVLVYLFSSNMLFLQSKLGNGARVNEFYEIGLWLDHNTQPGTIIFNANWSWFPQLYYWSPKDNYVSGLEPRLLYAYDPKLYWLDAHIADDGYVCDQEKCPSVAEARDKSLLKGDSTLAWAHTEGTKIADTLLQTFKTPYVVTSRDYRILNYIMDHNGRFKKELYNDQFGYYIFSVKP